MDARHLSKRLATAAEFVPVGARLADIGSDHAYLPAFLALRGRIEYAVAGEVVRGPYQNACREITREGLQEIIVPRLADGLAAINADDRIDTVTICGMGAVNPGYSIRGSTPTAAPSPVNFTAQRGGG